MDLASPVIKLCIQVTRAEFKGQLDIARSLYQQAWEAARDDFEACVAAHYVACHQEDPEKRLHWNQEALDWANSVADRLVQEFYPSLFLNMARSYELLGSQAEARRYYDLAAQHGYPLHSDPG